VTVSFIFFPPEGSMQDFDCFSRSIGFGHSIAGFFLYTAPVFGFSTKLPVSEEERQWVDEGFRRLEKLLGHRRLFEAKVILPTPEYFPDPYDESTRGVEALFKRVCSHMHVDRSRVQLEIFADETEELRSILPYWQGSSGGCAGFFSHDPTPSSGPTGDEALMLVALRSTQLKDPLSLVATMAHELGHVILLGGGLMSPETADHEPLTDLLTVFLGFGAFTSSAARRFKQFQDERRYGWSLHRLGYLEEEVYGYALAKFADARQEEKPDWTKHLSTNVRSYFKRSQAWLTKNKFKVITAKPIG
jgi:hypothetical protein